MPYELTIIDADVPASVETEALSAFCCGDFDGDGRLETVVGGPGILMWHRPETGERGVIRRGVNVGVGLIAADLDGDGRPEVVTAYWDDAGNRVVRLKPATDDLSGDWDEFTIDPKWNGVLHDVVAADLDGDGVDELVGNMCYCDTPGLHLWKRGEDVAKPWTRHTIQTGKVEEGLAVADFDGDGRPEVASGVRVYTRNGDGLDDWSATEYAAGLREMCRVAAIDITGDNRPDLVAVDSEYLDGQLCWYRRDGDGWAGRTITRGLYYAHTLQARREGGGVRLVVAEMHRGGWNPPYNHRAKIYEFRSNDGGETWGESVLYEGAGTHEAELVELDGREAIVGKEWHHPRVHVFKKVDAVPFADWRHTFLDRDKPEVGIDAVVADVDGDGRDEVTCGRWWYDVETGERFEVPGVCQIVAAYDFDGDGRVELIATLRKGDGTGYDGLSSELAYCKSADPRAGEWTITPIGTGVGDWPHGCVAGPLGPGGRPALVTSYHSAHAWGDGGKTHYPDLWLPPKDPASDEWERRPIAEITYGEELLAYDVTGDGTTDVIAGCWWLENHGDGTFTPHVIVDAADFYPARCAVADLLGDGRPCLVTGREVMDYETKTVPWSQLAYFVPGEDVRKPWEKRVIDLVRCGHSIGVADFDGDGEVEIAVGEHYPFAPYRSNCKLFVYKKGDDAGTMWKRHELDHGYEHHDGCRPVRLRGGGVGLVSHAWQEPGYLHLWRGTA